MRRFHLVCNVIRMEAQSAFNAAIIAAIQEVMERARMTQADLACAAGIPLTTLHRRLHSKGGKSFEVVELLAICEALGIGFTDLALRAERAAATQAA